MSTVSGSDFPSSPGGGSSAQDSFNDSFNKTANTIATGAIVAIVICSVLAVVSLGVFIWWFRRWTKRRRDREASLSSSPLHYGGPPAAGPATAYPPQSPAPEMAGHTSRWEAPGHHHHLHHHQQLQRHDPSGASGTSGATAIESDGRPRYEMDGTAGLGPGPGGDPQKGYQYV